MRALSEPRKFTAPNGWGRDDTSLRQAFMVEPRDVGTSKPDYLGHRQPAKTFTRQDIGKVLEVITYPAGGYHSWAWGSVFPEFPKKYNLHLFMLCSPCVADAERYGNAWIHNARACNCVFLPEVNDAAPTDRV